MKKNFVHAPLSYILVLTFVLLFAFSSCGTHHADSQALETDSLSYTKYTKTLDVSYKVECPIGGNKALLRSIREFISESLGDGYAGDLDEGDSLVAYYAKADVDSLDGLVKEYEDAAKEYGDSEVPQLLSHVTVSKAYETDNLVTYIITTESYTGGAHGGHTEFGATFRKSDGRKFGSDMFVNSYADGLTSAMKQGLMRYFKVSNEAQLRENLMDVEPYDIPMPQYPPYLTSEGLTFTYQEYEIAAYAAGRPTFTIPLSQIKPQLIKAFANEVK